MGFVSLFLFLIGLVSFLTKKKHITLITILILASSYFRLVPGYFLLGSLSLQHGDLALLLIFILIPINFKGVNSELKGIEKGLLLFLVFLAISIIYDFSFRGTSLLQIFRTTRKIGYLMFFFLLGSFNWRDYKKLFVFLVLVTLLHATFYISQYIFGYSYTPSLDILKVTMVNELGSARYTNGPTYIIPILVICIFTFFRTNIKMYLVVLLVVSVILGQSRGAIISVFSILILYLYLQNKIKMATLILLPILSFIVYTLLLIYFPVINERFIHLFNEINLIGDMDYNNLNSFYHEGSFIFRFGVTYERFIYVLEDPIRILLGVGYVPDIDITHPIFTIGTISPMLPTGFEQYNSVDIFFPNIITRYGLVGSIIYLYLIITIIVFSYKNKVLLWGKILFTYLCSLIFISLINETFYNGIYFIIIFIFLGMILNEKKIMRIARIKSLVI
ncbi:O-antigen ligase family protein [Lutibacter holmesii]|uniref:O-antigen ligase family protein n=1 Tax=Lutibacter holmesii TaxID=1137985 RepID=A0ABW3WSF5_9FLAO